MSAMAVPPGVAQRAVEWLVELQAQPLPDEVRLAWQQWRDSHPDHERAWQRIEAVNGKLRTLGGPQHPAAAAALLAPRSRQRRHAIKTLSVLFFTGGLAWTAQQQLPWRSWTADERSSSGKRRNVALSDGSTVAMNAGAAFDIDYDQSGRRLRLRAGEIVITTAPDQRERPFTVHTAQGTLQALGTRFAVRLYDAATHVSVFDGAVELRPQGGTPSRTLQAGQQALFNAGAIMPTLAADEDSIAWTDGFLIARSMRLADFLAELNRYSEVTLSCAPQVANLRVSGSYPLDDVQLVLETLSATLALNIETQTRFWGRYRSGIRLAPKNIS
ncbi:FecR family protein [Duganella sp. sic0402]|uniref:FecR family protein n=1 Tax=Duganella sp. sic0402 TaxID=2854786 RepID=UPI001E49E27E|nr:FecR family protein [Duganella sp. sic0402]